ncbi:hypothetical protein FHT03_002355 [Xanthomonas arboricola]|nr:hypothetical protein [Xanthomonas cannabis]
MGGLYGFRQRLASCDAASLLFNKPPANCLVRCPRRLRDRWRHGCRHRASTDGFTACPASGEGAAPSTDLKIAKRSRDARCSRRYLIAQFWKIRRKTDHLRRCCRALARPPSRDTLQVRPCSSVAASVPPWLPRRWAGKDQSSWLVRKVLNEQRQAATRCLDSSTKPPAICLAWCPRRLRDRVAAWCRHRATWTYLRRVPRAVRAPRPRPTRHLAWTSDGIAKTWPENHCTHADTHAHTRTHV